MAEPIPAPVLAADAVYHAILERVAFSRHLNPMNVEVARTAFLAGAPAPPFEYIPLDEADEIRRELDRAEPPREHPMGDLVGRCFDGTRLVVAALSDRTAEAFDAMAVAAEWYPDESLLGLAFAHEFPEVGPPTIPAPVLEQRLRAALHERGLDDWRIEKDTVMAARVLVDGAKRLVRLNPDSWFRENDLVRLVVHEIDVHVVRTRNGEGQALRCFETGLPGSVQTDEGMALVAEERAGVSSPGTLARQLEVVRAIDHARRAGFREVYLSLARRVGPGLAWGIALRVKRGLADPSSPGTYAKDSVYLRGRMQVQAWLADGGPIEHLYVGKVGLHDPIETWLKDGWVQPRPVPALWTAKEGGVSPPAPARASPETPPSRAPRRPFGAS